MSWYEILALIGIPSVLTILLNYFERKSIRKEQAQERERVRKEAAAAAKDDRITTLSLAIQALLRAQMLDDYNHYTDKGFAPVYARESYEACWKQYQALGGNGVMADLHSKFIALPTDPPHRQTV